MAFELPKLDYAYDALEPHIDAKTMEIHHTKHHDKYTSTLNDSIKGTDFEKKSIEEILSTVSKAPSVIRNNAGGFYNHKLFWKWLSPKGGGQPTGELLNAINKEFGSFDGLKEKFNKAAAGQFGSGWAWLIKSGNGNLVVTSTPNQDNTLMDLAEVKGSPILGLDVWEHAYYLKYQNRRPDYVNAFWNVVNWDEVNRRFRG
jgi:Fe-Mn family superoxide dismutase